MTRLPRRPSRVKPPLRGRVATQQYRGEFAPLTSVRHPLRPYRSGTLPKEQKPIAPPWQELEPPIPAPDPTTPTPCPSEPSLYTALVKFYQSWVRLMRALDQPWQWLLGFAILLSGLFLLSQIL